MSHNTIFPQYYVNFLQNQFYDIRKKNLLAERRNDPLSDKIGNLCFVTRNGKVTDCPGGLFLSLKFSFTKVCNDHWHKTSFYDWLDLLLVSSSYIWQEPYSLLDIE